MNDVREILVAPEGFLAFQDALQIEHWNLFAAKSQPLSVPEFSGE